MKMESLSIETQATICAIAKLKGISPEEVLAHFYRLYSGRKVSKHSLANNRAWGVFSTPLSV